MNVESVEVKVFQMVLVTAKVMSSIVIMNVEDQLYLMPVESVVETESQKDFVIVKEAK